MFLLVSILLRPTGEAVASDSAPKARGDVHVRVAVERSGPSALDYVVQLVIDDGWHINANPSSNRFLIPTTVELVDDSPIESVVYPPGKPFRASFSPTELSVYDGTIRIPIRTPAAAGSTLVVRYQACTERRCQRPVSAKLALP
jgi:hypothetical protein